METLNSFSLYNIAEWQLNENSSKVELPSLQRGFVWKANQIESVWDSILRGFPIGSFLLSENVDGKQFLLDGQQRATSITIGFYNPWTRKNEDQEKNFWSLKSVPVLWIDLDPNQKTTTQKFVLRVATKSHPWGYQRVSHNSILSVPDRRNALEILRKNEKNKGRYSQLHLTQVFPYDSDLPVPLSFLIESINSGNNWHQELTSMCQKYLPVDCIKTKYQGSESYLDKLGSFFKSTDESIFFSAVKNLETIRIPISIVKSEVLKADDEGEEDSTLFVRLNSSGTRIAGEELVYSIYKASFPQTKDLVEKIGADFVAPSLVISLVSRLVWSEIYSGNYPKALNVNSFRKEIENRKFSHRMKELIDDENSGSAKSIFDKAFKILKSSDMPPVLIKQIIKSSPDLFLMLLQWVKCNENVELDADENRKILSAITALSWFGRDNNKYVSEVWKETVKRDFWSKESMTELHYGKKDYIIHPFVSPEILRQYLKSEVIEKRTDEVIEKRTDYDNLYPHTSQEIIEQMKFILKDRELDKPSYEVWTSFRNRLFGNKSLILFAQRKYINDKFGDFNQMDTLEDTNTPWDWDHIYPSSWVVGKHNIDGRIRRWNNSIGNLRAMALSNWTK
jgi:hypothetical protein